MSPHCLLAFIASDKKSTERNLYLCSYVCNVSFFFLLGCPLSFLFMFLFQQFGYDVSRCFLSVSVYVYFLFGCARPQLWYVESWIFIITCGIFSWRADSELWHVGSRPEVELGPPVLGMYNLSHWTTREIPGCAVLNLFILLGIL